MKSEVLVEFIKKFPTKIQHLAFSIVIYYCMIYFDNSATLGFVPRRVKKAVARELNNPANAGRSGHRQAVAKLKMINGCRTKLAEMFGCSFERTIFCKSCTEALNLAIFGTVKSGSHIVTTALEHNSVLRPLYSLKNVTISVAEPTNGRICASDIEKHITDKTDIVILNIVSNVTGAMSDYIEIAALCKKKNIKLICDGAQAASHLDLNIKKSGISALAIAPHKSFYAPAGLGVLFVSDETASLKPLIFGGNGLNSDNVFQTAEFPEGFESGTQNSLAIAALSAGIDYFFQNKKSINRKTEELSYYLYDKLQTVKNIKLFSQKNPFGIASFLIGELDSGEIADYLDAKYSIAVRSGLTCAPFAHKMLGTTNSGLARVSVAHFNTKRQVDKLIFALKKL